VNAAFVEQDDRAHRAQSWASMPAQATKAALLRTRLIGCGPSRAESGRMGPLKLPANISCR